MLSIGSLVWGTRDVARAVTFWTQALDYVPREDPGEDWAVLVPRSGSGAQLALSEVSSVADTHRRHHLDLYTEDQDGEVQRLIRLGAHRIDWRYPEDADYVVLEDPDGNRFCVVQRPPRPT